MSRSIPQWEDINPPERPDAPRDPRATQREAGGRRRAGREPPDESPLLRTIAMPADANPNGDIFGGWLMGLMDLAAGNAAGRRARGRVATVAVDAIVFHSPVLVGDEVSIYGRIVAVGRSSMKIEIEAWRRERADDAANLVTEALFTFVAIDAARRPRPVPSGAVPGE